MNANRKGDKTMKVNMKKVNARFQRAMYQSMGSDSAYASDLDTFFRINRLNLISEIWARWLVVGNKRSNELIKSWVM